MGSKGAPGNILNYSYNDQCLSAFVITTLLMNAVDYFWFNHLLVPRNVLSFLIAAITDQSGLCLQYINARWQFMYLSCFELSSGVQCTSRYLTSVALAGMSVRDV